MDWVYYSNWSESDKLYKVKTDGTDRVKISNDNIRYINLIGDYIFYINSSDGGKLYMMKTDGSERRAVEALKK